MKNILLTLACCVAAAIAYVAVGGGADRPTSVLEPAAEESVGRGGAAVYTRSLRRAERHHQPGAPVQLTYDVPSTMRVGETVIVVLELQSAYHSGRMEVQANLPLGLSTIGVAHQVYYHVEDEPVQRWELPIHATQVGNLHLGIIVKEYDDSGNPLLGRAFAVPVVVGDEAANTTAFMAEREHSPYLVSEESWRLLVEMPASPPLR